MQSQCVAAPPIHFRPPSTVRVRSRGVLLALLLGAGSLGAQRAVPPDAAAISEANYRLAARFAPYKWRRLVYSTAITPRWIKGSERFWYEWESANGKQFTIVDPVAGTQSADFFKHQVSLGLDFYY